MKSFSFSIVLLMLFILGISKFSFAFNNPVDIYGTDENTVSLTVSDDNLLYIEDADPSLPLGNRKPLLLVHGWNFGEKPSPPSNGTWNNFLAYYNASEELKANFKPYLVKYWSNAIPIKDISALMVKRIEAIGFNNKRMVILAHSMGGLVSRSFMIDQSFTSGISAGKKCGEMVDLIVTLSSPHHGSPMSNGPARDAKLSFFFKLIVPTLDSFVFSDTKYNEQNRQDMHWDNYDNLLDYAKYPNEANLWLSNMNSNTSFDHKMVCYSASVTGSSTIPTTGNVRESYEFGAYIMYETFRFSNDGIVPISSSRFDGHSVKRIREYKEYNHADIFQGKTDQEELMGPIKTDLLEAAPVRLLWPNNPYLVYKFATNLKIEWDAPLTISKVNLLFSTNGGKTYVPISENVDATLKSFLWDMPSANSDNCYIKIVDADNATQADSCSFPFSVYHIRASQIEPKTDPYLAVGKLSTIQWTVEGPASKARVYYSDIENGETFVLSYSIDVKPGINTINWQPNDTISATQSGIITIQLFDIDENYNDNSTYTFTSDRITMLGKSNIEVLSPKTFPADEGDGFFGEKLVVGNTYNIEWQSMGEIKKVQIFLCDSNKTVIKKIGEKDNTPALNSNGFYAWKVEPFNGNKFYFMLKAGASESALLVDDISDNHFRINYLPIFVAPLANSNNVSLLPKFEVQKISTATRYEWHLSSQKVAGEQVSWTYSSLSNIFSVPNNIENELTPGNEYSLACTVFHGHEKSYPSEISFNVEKAKPYNFSTLLPLKGEQTELKTANLTWSRAVGAEKYKVSIWQKGKLIEEANIEKEDTAYFANLSGLELYEPINWVVTATNGFGDTKAESNFSLKNKNNVKVVSSETSFRAYPNPFANYVTFSFDVPSYENDKWLKLEIFNIEGKSIASFVNSNHSQGSNSFTWNLDAFLSDPPKGIYYAKLVTNSKTHILKIIRE